MASQLVTSVIPTDDPRKELDEFLGSTIFMGPSSVIGSPGYDPTVEAHLSQKSIKKLDPTHLMFWGFPDATYGLSMIIIESLRHCVPDPGVSRNCFLNCLKVTLQKSSIWGWVKLPTGDQKNWDGFMDLWWFMDVHPPGIYSWSIAISMFCTPLAHILNRETVALGQVTTDEPPLLVPGGRDDAAVILGEYPQHMIYVMYVCIYIIIQ